MAYPPPAPSEDPCCAGGPDEPPQNPQSIVVAAYPPPAPDEFPCCIVTQLLTTTVYPIEGQDVFATFADQRDGRFDPFVDYLEDVQSFADMRDSELRALVIEYDNYPPEELEVFADMRNGTFAAVVIPYDNYPTEDVEVFADMLNGTLT
jgi:hypothetical protein